jgi:hypothetical protein
MAVHLICVLGLTIFAADPMAPAGSPAQVNSPGPVFSFGAAGDPLLAQAAPLPPAGDAALVPVVDVPAGNTPAIAPEGVHYFTLDELRAEMRKFAWTKGDFTIVPYGILWANLVEETGRTYPGNYPLYVSRPREDANADCYVDVRSTRLGIDVLGPQIPCLDCAQSGGKVEIDFQRQIDVENKPSLLLRHAYVEVKNDDFRLLAGQTWDVISPLTPGVLFYSVGWDAGNIGYRRPQFRAERYLRASDTCEFVAQGSLNTIAPTDTAGTAETYTALPSDWPILEGRLAMVLGRRGPGCLPWEWGVSGHTGDMIYDFHQDTAPLGAIPTSPFGFTEIGAHRRTWSLDTDLRIPITQSFGVQGELFMGENLGPFYGGVGQSVDIVPSLDPKTGVLLNYASGNDIRSRGGWVDVWYDWTPRLHSHTGYSIDNPYYEDVTSGRVYNAFYFANISYDVTPKFLVGFEFTSWKTIWVGPSEVANSQNFDFVVKYGF